MKWEFGDEDVMAQEGREDTAAAQLVEKATIHRLNMTSWIAQAIIFCAFIAVLIFIVWVWLKYHPEEQYQV